MRALPVTAEPGRPGPGEKGLRRGVLSLVSSVVIGVSSPAPAYSLAASLGFIVVLAGDKAPAVMLLAFVPMLLIALAYRALNAVEPDCGTSFTWAGRAFGPWAGWMGGWGLIVADIIVMANLAQIAGQYTFLLLGADVLADSTVWTTVVGVAWIALMTFLCVLGLGVSARVQYALLGIELTVLAAFAVVALVRVYGADGAEGSIVPAATWLWPSGLVFSDFVDAVLIAVFLYWGWDAAVACNEESVDPTRNPGRSAVMSTALLVVIYTGVTTAAVAFAGVGPEGGGLADADDVFAVIAPAVFGDSGVGRFFGVLLIISVLTSAAGSTQTTIMPTARAALSMGGYRAIPARFAQVNTRRGTPDYATWATGAVAIVFYVGLTLASDNVLADSIAAVGLLIAFYYGLTAFACVWYFRRQLRGWGLWTKGVLPALGGMMLMGAFVQSAVGYASPDAGETSVFGIGGVFVIGIGALLLGAALMILYSRIAPDYFQGRTLVRADRAEPPSAVGS